MSECVKAEWRGVTVCKHMVPFLDEFAAATGAFVVRPIPNYGSYEHNPASSGTDLGGGHLDIYMTRIPVGMTRWQIEAIARRILGLAYDRVRLVKNGQVYWTDHMHIEDPRCPNLSPKAAEQFPRFEAGRNNLASNGPDKGDRTYVAKIMALFNARKSNAAAGKYPPIVPKKAPVTPPVPPPAKPAVGALPTFPPNPAVLTAWSNWHYDGLREPHPKPGSANPFWSPQQYLANIYIQNEQILANQKEILARLPKA